MKRNQRGMSLAEVVVSLAIVSVTILATVTVVTGSLTATRNNMDRQFATQKAISILEELRSVIQSSDSSSASVLDAYDDLDTDPVLTTQRVQVGSQMLPPEPDSTLSGNVTGASTPWLYARRVVVQPLPSIQSNDVRLVRVQVFKNEESGQRLLAEVASVLRNVPTQFPPSQVYDVYALAIENVPGWWVYMSNLIPFVSGSIQDLQARNPGLEYRVHWITKLAYGRDQEYKPYLNTIQDSKQPIDWAYFYPGRMPAGSTDDFYYPPFQFGARMNFDGTEKNGYDNDSASTTYNPLPYALADQYNHAMRLPDEMAMFNARVAAGVEDPDTPTLRLLLEQMYSDPDRFRNAIIINLHGELFPFPPIRNFSDAAKRPKALPNVRVVTHPEQLRYRAAEDVTLRVYSYRTNPKAVSAASDWLTEPITILLRDVTWTPSAGQIQRISGGTNQDGAAGSDPYALTNAPTSSAGNQMYYSASTVGSDTVIKLYNSPLQSPCVPNPVLCTNGGLFHENDNETRRLYGLEYIPAPVEDLTANLATATTAFTEHLASPGDFAKNTARWVIRIPASAVSGERRIDIETRIGDDLTTGVLYPTPNEPTNLSRTYTWKGTNNWAFGTATTAPNVPYTERYQILGDPRHLPYSDLKRPHEGSGMGANTNFFGLGYNPFFDDFESSSEDAMGAELIGSVEGNFIINNKNGIFGVMVNGGGVISYTLPKGTYSAVDIAKLLNDNVDFSAAAIAYAHGHRIRVVARNGGYASTIQFDHDSKNNSGSVLGMPVGVQTRKGWEGWQYKASDGVVYGVKNNNNANDDGSRTAADYLEIDFQRIGEMVRTPMMRTNALWTTLTGFSYFYVGIGGEIGYDKSSQFPNSIPVSEKPYNGGSGSGWEQTILPTIPDNTSISCLNGCGVKVIQENGGTGWWSMSWLGELYPDDRYDASGSNDWVGAGNLPTGTGAGTFRRTARQNLPTTLYPTPLNSGNDMPGSDVIQSVRRLSGQGCRNFFWTGTTTATYGHTNHDAPPNTSTRMPAGIEIQDNYAMPVPDDMPTNRPFQLDKAANTASNPDFFLTLPYGGANHTSVLSGFYDFAETAKDGSSLLGTADPGTPNVMFVVANGISPVGVTGTGFIARWSLLTLIHSYFVAGQYSYDGSTTMGISGTPHASRVKQVPRVRITDPNSQTMLSNPSTVNIAWAAEWSRWDGRPYTDTYNAQALALDQAIPLSYSVLYSRDHGVSWLHIKDETPAELGKRPAATYLQSGTSYNWNVADTLAFPQGNYIIRIEAYRDGLPLHYSYHQYRAFIDR